MDKILEALVSSSHPLAVKRAIVKKVMEAAEKEVTEEQCQALYHLTTRLILLGEDAFQRQVGLQVQEAYARYHRDEFARFFSKEYMLGLLQQGYGSLDRRDPAILDFLHSSLRLLISCPAVLELAPLLQTEVLRIICERPEPATCAKLATILTDFPQCVPREKAGVLFCQQLVRTFAYFHCPATEEQELREYVTQVTRVSVLLQGIWKAEPATLLPSLQEVFAIISSTDPSFEPSIALASLVQHIPLQMITVLIKSLTTDQNVKDASMTQALCRMIDWLSWPLANHVDTWVIALLKGLAAVQKFTILIDVTLLKIEQVFNRLWYPIVRQAALVVLSHMLLSFQHSPEAFHLNILKVVPHIVPLVKSLKNDGLPNSKTFLLQFAELVHCMMYQYSGFPDLYDSILESIKELPKPNEEKIKFILNQSAWTSQSNSFASGLLKITGKSETGKTGLVNLGNTCYMNSIIQILFMATERHVMSLHLNGSSTLMKKLQLLFAFLAHTQRAAYSPRSFLEVSRPPWFTAGSQQDCSEYLRFLLDRLHEEEKTLSAFQVTSPKPEPATTSAETVQAAAGQPITDMPSHPDPVAANGDGRTLVERMFGGRLSTAIRCLQCHSLSEKEEPFTDLSLAFCPSMSKCHGPAEEHKSSSSVRPCQGAVNGGSESSEGSVKEGAGSGMERPVVEPTLSVPDLVDYFLAPEILENENCYFCERCASLQRAKKVMQVVMAPEYLILTLLRFSYDATCHVRRKILDNVGIPLHMSLPLRQHGVSALSSSPSDSPESGENLAKKLKPSQKEDGMMENRRNSEINDSDSEMLSVPYVLSSVVVHSGMSSESGHYYSYGRNASSTNSYVAHPCPKTRENSSLAESSPATQEERGCADHKSTDWFLFNDSRVSFTNFESLQNVTSRFPKDTAYVLVYRKQEVSGQPGSPGPVVNGSRLSGEPPLQKELMDAITKDNKLFLQEQELNARARALQATSASCSFRPNGSDDNEPPGSCGPSGGGGGGGFNTISRLVF
ncbi:ubiquitin carboxyl-terminal hydrolase 38-like isoform X2 [Carassius auratus]|uniref:Ubiquitin carboxyl-terminal hydrolase 38-like isoform X2 n=1 Tax=Carassius auratus TaxID=7957 RepID=A0A6P6QUR9_CARAU|nr:ubiquitin carboxyl-terminal hydrolase 38-like isoform X2 [Carassius auratus]